MRELVGKMVVIGSIGSGVGTWVGVQNVPRCAWVKTLPTDVSQQTWRLPFCWQRPFLPTRCEVQNAPPVPPPLYWTEFSRKNIAGRLTHARRDVSRLTKQTGVCGLCVLYFDSCDQLQGQRAV
jgi:hypothetical protein